MEKYNAVAFSNNHQICQLQSKEYDDKIEEFIKKNERKGYKVVVDLLTNKKIERQVYKTKN